MGKAWPESRPQPLNVKELADYLRVHQSSIYRMCKRGQIPGFKVGANWRFNIEEIDAWRMGKKP